MIPTKAAMAPAVWRMIAPRPRPNMPREARKAPDEREGPQHPGLAERGHRRAARQDGLADEEARQRSGSRPPPATGRSRPPWPPGTAAGEGWRPGRSGWSRCRTRRSSLSTPSTPMASEPEGQARSRTGWWIEPLDTAAGGEGAVVASTGDEAASRPRWRAASSWSSAARRSLVSSARTASQARPPVRAVRSGTAMVMASVLSAGQRASARGGRVSASDRYSTESLGQLHEGVLQRGRAAGTARAR